MIRSLKKPLLVIIITFTVLICVQQIGKNSIGCDYKNPITSIEEIEKPNQKLQNYFHEYWNSILEG